MIWELLRYVSIAVLLVVLVIWAASYGLVFKDSFDDSHESYVSVSAGHVVFNARYGLWRALWPFDRKGFSDDWRDRLPREYGIEVESSPFLLNEFSWDQRLALENRATRTIIPMFMLVFVPIVHLVATAYWRSGFRPFEQYEREVSSEVATLPRPVRMKRSRQIQKAGTSVMIGLAALLLGMIGYSAHALYAYHSWLDITYNLLFIAACMILWSGTIHIVRGDWSRVKSVSTAYLVVIIPLVMRELWSAYSVGAEVREQLLDLDLGGAGLFWGAIPLVIIGLTLGGILLPARIAWRIRQAPVPGMAMLGRRTLQTILVLSFVLLVIGLMALATMPLRALVGMIPLYIAGLFLSSGFLLLPGLQSCPSQKEAGPEVPPLPASAG